MYAQTHFIHGIPKKTMFLRVFLQPVRGIVTPDFFYSIIWSSMTESKATGSVPSISEFGDSSGKVFHGLGAQT
jgi:hypothetical protein